MTDNPSEFDQPVTPDWLNIETVHPAETLAQIPAMVDAARGILEAVARFNRDHLEQMSGYYERNYCETDGVSDLVDELTGMKVVDDYLVLAAYVIEYTVVGQGLATDAHAARLIARHASLVEGVRLGNGSVLSALSDDLGDA